MATDDPRGFVECRHLGGAVTPSTYRYPIEADGGRSAQFAKYAGDPFVLASGQYVARGSADNSGGVPLIGVARALYYNSNGKPKSMTFGQPNNGPVLPASVAGWAEINVDPFQTYLANTDTTVLGTNIGQYVGTTVGSPNTAAGRSGFMIKISTATNSANVTTPWQIIGIAPTELDGLTQTEGNQDVEVKIAYHAFATLNLSVSGARSR
jgi:hypothetical protein